MADIAHEPTLAFAHPAELNDVRVGQYGRYFRFARTVAEWTLAIAIAITGWAVTSGTGRILLVSALEVRH